MLQPSRLALALALVWGAAVEAQPSAAARMRRERVVTVPSAATAPLPVVHVAHDTPTLLLFPAPINRKTLTFDESRIRVLDAGERSVIVQPVADLPEGERYEVGVFFADGRAPARAAFSLATDPAEVDTRIDVQRPELTDIACPVDVPRTPRPEDFVLLGFVDKEGVTATLIKPYDDASQGFSSPLEGESEFCPHLGFPTCDRRRRLVHGWRGCGGGCSKGHSVGAKSVRSPRNTLLWQGILPFRPNGSLGGACIGHSLRPSEIARTGRAPRLLRRREPF